MALFSSEPGTSPLPGQAPKGWKPPKAGPAPLPHEYQSQTQRFPRGWNWGGKLGGSKGGTGGGGSKGKGGAGGGGINFNDPLYDPTKTLKGKTLYDAAKALADAQVGTAIDELNSQIGRNRQQGQAAQKLTSGYFGQLGQQAQQAYQNSRASADQLNQTLAGQAASAQSQLQGFGQQATGGTLAGMAAQGLDGGSMARLAQELASRQQSSTQTAQAISGAGASQGGNYQGLAASNQGTYALRGQERLGDIGRATELANFPLQSKVGSLTARRSALVEAAIGKLREQERNYGLAQQGLGIKQQSANQTATRDAVNARLGEINAQLKAAGLSETQRHNLQTEQAALQRINSPGKGGGKAGSAANARSDAATVDKIVSLISNARQNGFSDGDIRGFLSDGRNPTKRAYGRNLINQAFGRVGKSSAGGGTGGGLAGLGNQGNGFF